MESLSIVIPCFNEADGISQLSAELLPVVEELRKDREVELLFIDDGSTDGTLPRLEEAFGSLAHCRILKHPVNRNLGAALRTGMEKAKGNLVAFLDADCTYRPEILFRLLPVAEKGADLVLASPYHPEGEVVGVPGWRLFLSRSLSRLYGLLLRPRLHTYTGMVRVFRASAFERFQSRETEFTFVTLFTLWALSRGLHVAEVPAVLRTRTSGVSKLRTLRVVRKHLKILGRLLLGRPL